MKVWLYLLIFLLCNISMKAQLQMGIKTLTISKLVKESNDSSSIQIYKEGDRDSPYIEAEFYIKNISDTTIILHPKSSDVYLKYQYNGKILKNNMVFYLKDSNIYSNEVLLKSNEEIKFLLCGYMINVGTLLEVEFIKMYDRRDALIKILPTLKFMYIEQDGTIVENSEILQVIIK